MLPVHARSHHVPATTISRNGCPCVMTPYTQTAELPPDDRIPVLRQYTTMQLVHYAKDKTVKCEYSLKNIHDNLAAKSLVLRGSGSSNILNSALSFECLITTKTGTIRDRITFPLKIKGTNTKDEQVLSYEVVEEAYGSKAKLYGAMKHIYGKGVQSAQNLVHGHQPDYNLNEPQRDQFIRHTEQLLVAYLALPEAAQMICDQLRGSIRAKYHDAVSVKVYNMALHMDSTKTCCAPCEYTLLGMMNDRDGFHFKYDPNKTTHGFLLNFTRNALKPSETLPFRLPTKSLFRLLVTVTASEAGLGHTSQPVYQQIDLGTHSFPTYDIDVKSHVASSKIFTTMVNQQYDRRKIPTDTDLSGTTIGISGSKKTKGSPGTIGKVKTKREEELVAENLIHKFDNMEI